LFCKSGRLFSSKTGCLLLQSLSFFGGQASRFLLQPLCFFGG
jgi:hypothetical protein